MVKPNFERMEKALRLEGEPDRVPFIEGWIDYRVASAFLGKPIRNFSDWVEFWCKAGYDFIHIVPPYSFPSPRREVHFNYSLYEDQLSSRSWVEQHRGAITNEEEFSAYDFPSPEEVDYSIIAETRKALPEGMKIITGTGGIFEETSFAMGFETLALSLYDEPKLVAKVFDKVGEILTEITDIAAEACEDALGALWLSDDIAYTEGTFFSPSVYRKYLFPWYKRFGEICKKYDVPFLFHSDGKLWDILDDLIECGVNAIHPIEPKAMDIREVKERYGDKLCILGGLNLDYPLSRGTPKEVEEEVKRLIKEIAPGGGYCLGSSNSIPEYVPLENYKAMLESGLKYGKYPISL
ncbi:nucleoside 2-deoxyribosyltransferase [bacterium]|nr:nucleoside 2-deoxyribosyltransferase [bacterium]